MIALSGIEPSTECNRQAASVQIRCVRVPAASQRLSITTNIASPSTVRCVVGRRLHHRAGVHRPRPQGQSSPLWPQWTAAWPLVPRSRTYVRAPSSVGRSGPSDLFVPPVRKCTITHTTREHVVTLPKVLDCVNRPPEAPNRSPKPNMQERTEIRMLDMRAKKTISPLYDDDSSCCDSEHQYANQV